MSLPFILTRRADVILYPDEKSHIVPYVGEQGRSHFEENWKYKEGTKALKGKKNKRTKSENVKKLDIIRL